MQLRGLHLHVLFVHGRARVDVLQQLPERSANPLCSDGSPVWQPENQPLSDDEAAEVGRFWYAVAAGEIQFDAAIVL